MNNIVQPTFNYSKTYLNSDYYLFLIIINILLFTSIINNYLFSTTYLIELTSLFIIFYGILLKKMIRVKQSAINSLAMFSISIIFCLYFSFKVDFEIDGFAKETYRLFSFFLIYFALFFVDIQYEKVFRLILQICKLYVFYNLYELIYINLISPGNIEGLIFGKGILNYYNSPTETAYFNAQWELGIPFIRPFGFCFQPQKSAFIFPIAIIILFVIRNYFSPSNKIWYSIFFISTILTGAKTAILASIFILIVINIDFFKVKMTRFQFLKFCAFTILILVSIFFIIYFSNSDHSSSVAIKKDLIGLSNLKLTDILFGAGFLSAEKLRSMGFSGESFILRLITQLGFINFSAFALLFIALFIKRINKIIILLLVLFIAMTLHYAIINIPLFLFIISLILAHETTNYSN